MRRRPFSRLAALVGLTGLLACGEAPPATAPAPGGVLPAPAPSLPVASLPALAASAEPGSAEGPAPAVPARSEPVGHLIGPSRLAHVFEALGALEDGRSHRDVTIVQYGDSHTASDLAVAVLRRSLQARFGDGGRGFVSLGKPWKGYGQDGVRGSMDRDFEPAKVKYRGGSFSGAGGCYGLLGVGVATSKAGARAWTDLAASASHLELAYAQVPGGGSFDVLVDGVRAGRTTTRATAGGGGFLAVDVPDAPHHVEVRAAGDGEVTLYGLTADRSEAGVVVDTLGINGAQILTPLRWSEACFAEQLRHVAPELVVLAYGTNEALEPGLTDADYERSIVDLLGRIARATPAASCMLLGPPDLARHTKGQDDWKTLPRIVEIVAAQKRVAEAAGCAFYDQMEAMGGPGSMAQWASEPEPRGGHDRVHLTRAGYAELGRSLVTDLSRAYDEWRADRGMRPTGAPKTWGSARR